MSYTSRAAYEFISQQTNDPIVERKICCVSGAEFPIFQSDLDFYMKISPTFAGQKFAVPTPTLCPEERQRRRLAFRNERKLYKRKCDASGENIISTYSPDKPYKVYESSFRQSDKRDAMDYGKDFDDGKSFTEQMSSLVLDVPVKALISEYNENCEYTSICGYCKNCYLLSASEKSEDCYYSHLIQNSRNIYDSSFIFDSELLYRAIDCKACTSSKYIVNCYHSSSLFLCVDLHGCYDCIGCHNLVNKSYCINNRQLTKEEYIEQKEHIMNDIPNFLKNNSLSGIIDRAIKKAIIGTNNENCFGSPVNDSKNTMFSYEIDSSDTVRYSTIVVEGRDIRDCSNVYIDNNLSYEVMSALRTNMNLFSACVYNCRNVLYSFNLSDCSDCFACTGLRNKSYCILNKQYTKEQYEQTVATIISHMQTTGEWGEFLHPSLSPFGYNESVAQDYFVVASSEFVDPRDQSLGNSNQQLAALGYKWSNYSSDPVIPVGTQTLSGDAIPSDITTVTDDILKKVLICEVSGRPYRIVAQELAFYRQNHLPLPRRHPDQRHSDRMALRPPREMHLRKCDKTGSEMISVYPQDVPFKVYSEEAYTQEVYG